MTEKKSKGTINPESAPGPLVEKVLRSCILALEVAEPILRFAAIKNKKIVLISSIVTNATVTLRKYFTQTKKLEIMK